MASMTPVAATPAVAPSFFSAAYWSAVGAKVKAAVAGAFAWTSNMWATSLAFKAVVILGTAALIGLVLYALLAKCDSKGDAGAARSQHQRQALDNSASASSSITNITNTDRKADITATLPV